MTLLLVLALAAPAGAAQINFVEQFLDRYRPSRVEIPPSPAERAQTLTE
ncbi:MAG: hypothetical protein HY646_22635, partial [Acidobacteria bacterium]|nr:hypothetical protein [Acidobacteriota bacterium]